MSQKPSSFSYDPLTIEPRWQKSWEESALFQHAERQDVSAATKMYLLFAFAYPSGSGLHVGHVESKTALDMLARFYRMNGKKVFFPVGWDAFGLPAENYAIKTGIPPAVTTKNAIQTFRRQIKRLGISYDWANETATNHPEYYRWTQWLFLQLYAANLAYRGTGMVNWCPEDQTVLANEQVVNGTCERCGAVVIQKDLEQWYFKITAYADELISGLDQVDWPKPTKEQQLHWIGRKQGVNIVYPVVGTDQEITCFSTRPETNFGATFIVLAPEHPFVQSLLQGKVQSDTVRLDELSAYVEKTKEKTELDRLSEGKKKTGVFTGFLAKNRLNNTEIPIWVSDFVLAGFGTGAVVGVPAHDKRDFQFADTMHLPVKRVVVGPDGKDGQILEEKDVYGGMDGTVVNSDFLDGLSSQVAWEKIQDYLEDKEWGKRVVQYTLRDWLISRQRYWGAPIPIVYDPQGNPHPVKEEHLPWELPTDVDFKPTGESPLKSSREFFARTEKLYGKGWTPECDTMDTFVDSSWYYLRYVDARNTQVFAAKEALEKWEPIDLYLIGPEHIVLHLLYSRFFTKFLRDRGYLKFDEPFLKMRHQGMILGPDGKKMSKSKGNVINPDDIIEKYGADTLRVYEMFMGPLESDKPWDTGSVIGVYRFLQRVTTLVNQASVSRSRADLQRVLHQTLQKVTADLPALKFNTAVAALMIFVNAWEKAGDSLSLSDVNIFVRMLAPFAPFLAEELFSHFSEGNASVHVQVWPEVDPACVTVSEQTLVVQVNGKVRASFTTDVGSAESEIVSLAQHLPAVQKWITGKTIQRTVYVPGKVLNFVITA